jgi:hypothetical protein
MHINYYSDSRTRADTRARNQREHQRAFIRARSGRTTGACIHAIPRRPPVHAYTHTCMHTHAHTCMHAFIHTFTHSHINTYLQARMHINYYSDSHTHADTRARIQREHQTAFIRARSGRTTGTGIHAFPRRPRMHAYTHTRIHAYTKAHTHTHIAA